MDMDSDGLSGIIGVPGWAKAQNRAAVDEWFEQAMSQKHVPKKLELLRLRQLNKFKRVHETIQETIRANKRGERSSEASQAGSSAGIESPQSCLGLETDYGPADLKISREWLPRNEFGDIKGLVRRTNNYTPRDQL
jgi:hypothetical protein